MNKRKYLAVASACLAALGGLLTVSPAAQAAVTTTVIQDTAQGSGVGQVQFSAGWNDCDTNCAKATTDNSFLWTMETGSSVTIRFSGNQISLFGVKEPWSYIATASIDGGAPVDVDEYAATATPTAVQVYTSPVLMEGTHSLVLTLTDRKNPASTGGKSFTFDRAEVRSGSASSSAHASGLPWSDGGYFMHDANQATAFAAWRGRPVDNILAFPSRESWPALLNDWWTGSVPASFVAGRDDFIVAVPLWTDDRNLGTDADWRQLASTVAAVDPNAYVRLGWEMNCCFSFATDVAAWRAQFSRAASLLKSVAPGLQIVFNPNEGASSPGLVADASTLFVAGKVDVIAIDAYDWYPPYNSTANADLHFTMQYGWNWWYDFARSEGLPFGLGEFSVATGSSASGGDNPAYFTNVYNWLSSKHAADPGSIAFVSLFNESDAYCTCNVYPTNANPNAAARYKSIINSLAQAG